MIYPKSIPLPLNVWTARLIVAHPSHPIGFLRQSTPPYTSTCQHCESRSILAPILQGPSALVAPPLENPYVSDIISVQLSSRPTYKVSPTSSILTNRSLWYHSSQSCDAILDRSRHNESSLSPSNTLRRAVDSQSTIRKNTHTRTPIACG